MQRLWTADSKIKPWFSSSFSSVIASSIMAEQQQQPTPAEQQQYPYTLAQQPPQTCDPNQQQAAAAAYDQNQQQAAAAYDPSYAAYYASYYQHQQQFYDPNAHSQQQPQQYCDYSQAYPHHQPVAPQIHSQQSDPAYHHYHPHYAEGHNGSRRGGGSPFRGGGRRGGGRGRGRGRGGGLNPNKHAPAIPAPPPPPVLKIWCEICRVECNSLEILQQHKSGKRHKKTAQKFEEMQMHQKLVAEYQANLTPGGTVHTAEYQQADAVPGAMQTTEHQQGNVLPAMPAMPANGYQEENAAVSAMHSSSVVDNAPSAAEQGKVLPAPENITTAEAASTQVEPVKAIENNSNSVQVDDPNKSHILEPEQKGKAASTEGTTSLANSGKHNQNDARRGGTKRKALKHFKGGRWVKKHDQRSIPEPHRICTVCNVTCESQVAFDAHIAGRKHAIKLRQFQQHGAVFGPITVYIPPNQPTAYPANRAQPLYFGLSSYQMVGQVTYSIEGGHHDSVVNQDAPLVFAQKESNEMGNDALRSESKDGGVEIAVAAEAPASGSELKEKSTSGSGDALRFAEDSALDSVSKENLILGTADAASVKEDVS